MLEFGGEKMSKSLGNDVSIRNVLDTWGREVALLFFMTAHWRKPIDFTDETLEQAKAQWQSFRAGDLRGKPARPSRRMGARSRRRSTTTSTRPRRWRSCTTGGARASSTCCAAAFDIFGLGIARRAAPLRRGACSSPRSGEAARAARTSPSSDELRDEIAAARLGRAGRRRTGFDARARVTREQVYGRRPVREALRGRREVLELWATERAVKGEAWLRETAQPRVQVKLERDISEAAGTRDHQGVLAWCEPYKYADAYELAATDRPLLACLDQVSDPRNLGAVCRSAEGAGATGVVVPSHGSARVTPAVCRASAGAVEHLPVAVVTNLARYLEEIKRNDGLWVAGAAGETGTPMWQSRSLRPPRVRVRRGGQGAAPARAPLVRPRGVDPAARAGRVAERQRRRRGAALRGAAAARWLSRRSTSSTASTSCTRAASARRTSCATCSRAGSLRKGARGVLVFDGHGADEEHGPLAVRWAPDADTLIERLAAEHRGSEQVAVVSSDEAVRGTSGAEVRKLSSRIVPRASSARPEHIDRTRGDLRDKLDAETLAGSSVCAAASISIADCSEHMFVLCWVHCKSTCNSLDPLLSSPSTLG